MEGEDVNFEWTTNEMSFVEGKGKEEREGEGE